MAGREPKRQDDGPRRPPTHAEMEASARTERRLVLGGIGAIGATLAGLAVGIPLMFPDAGPKQRLDNRRTIPPLLRARMELREPRGREADGRGPLPGDLAPEEALLVLSRAEMRDWNLTTDTPAPREALEVTAYIADDIWRATTVRLAVVAPGGAPDARLIAAQGGTVWAWAGQLVAAGPGWMGRTLDQAELARLNPDLGLDRPGLRARLGLAEALVLDAGPTGRDGLAFDPETRLAAPRTAPRAAPWPPLYPAPGFAGPALAREGRIGTTWFGLAPAGLAIPAAVAPQALGGAFLPPMPDAGPLRLWRGRVREAGEMLEAAAPVPGLDPIPAGGLLMAGPGRLMELADPSSVLLAQVGEVPGMSEWLRRLWLDGTTMWETVLPTTGTIAAALAEPARIWLLATPRGMSEWLHAIAPADGRLARSRGMA